MIRSARVTVSLALVVAMTAACSTAPATQQAKDDLVRDAANALTALDREIPGVESLVRGRYGYALFPSISKGGLGLGGAYGRGVVYAQGHLIGYADVTQGSLGLQVGGQTYRQLIVFDDKMALDRFTQGRFDLSADTSAVMIQPGYAESVQSIEGVTMFSRPIGGLMGELAMAGQQFSFVPR